MVGLTATLLRILFLNTLYTCRKLGNSKKHKREMEKVEISETKKGAVNHGIEISNDELYVDDMGVKKNNIRSRRPNQQSSPPNDDFNNDSSFLRSVDSKKSREIKKQGKTNEKEEEIVINVSNLY